MVTLFTDYASSSFRQSEEASNSNDDVTRQQQTSTRPAAAMAGIFGSSSTSSSSANIVKMPNEDNFGDCYDGLGMLPEVHRFDHSIFDFDDITRDDDKLL